MAMAYYLTFIAIDKSLPVCNATAQSVVTLCGKNKSAFIREIYS